MPKPVYLSPKEAMYFSKDDIGIDLTIPTIIKHAEKMGYGHQVGSKWQIHKEKFRRWLHGKKKHNKTDDKKTP